MLLYTFDKYTLKKIVNVVYVQTKASLSILS